MTTQSTEDVKVSIRTTILDMVNASWANDRKALLVAKVGAALLKDFNLRRDLNGLKLAEFIKAEMSTDVQFINSPKDPLIKALAPAGADLDADISNHFVSSSTRTADNQSAYRRININRRLWKAFSEELPDGQYRHVRFDPEIQFITNSSETHPGHYPIDRALINPAGTHSKQERNSIIQSNILTWAQTNGIENNLYILRTSDNSSTSDKTTVYSALIAVLNTEELSRINIPLDIILKLQSKYL